MTLDVQYLVKSSPFSNASSNISLSATLYMTPSIENVSPISYSLHLMHTLLFELLSVVSELFELFLLEVVTSSFLQEFKVPTTNNGSSNDLNNRMERK